MSSINVRAKAPGYFGHFREIGEEFVIEPKAGFKVVDEKKKKHTFSAEEQFSDRWMERVEDEDAPKKKGSSKAKDDESKADEDSVI